MDRQNLFKQMLNNKLYRTNKNMNNNIMMNFKNFKGQNNFNAKIDPISKETEEEINEMILASKKSKQYFFEWTDYKTKVKPYYDIDCWFDNKEEYELNLNKIRYDVLSRLEKLYPKISTSDIATSSSNGEKMKKGKKGWAISYHFVINNYECTIEELREFNEKNNLYDIYFEGLPKTKDNKMFDNSVYRDGGNMRFIYSYKPADNRQKIPVNNKDDYQVTNHIIQSNNITNKIFNKLPSPASTPVSTPNATDEEEEIMEFVPQININNNYNIDEIKNILTIIDDECYEYELWTKIGMAIHNITDGNEIGFGLYNEWSKLDDGYDGITELKKKWKSFGKKKTGNKVGYSFLKKLEEKYLPTDNKSLQSIFRSHLTNIENGEGRGKAKIEMLKQMNKRLIYIKKTSNFVVPTCDTICVYDDEGNITSTKQKSTYEVKKLADVKLDFAKEIFEYSFTDDEGKNKTIKINPLYEWINWIDRNEKEKIDFDPHNKNNPYIFNIWCGYNINKDNCQDADELEAQPMLDHIKNIWCRDVEEDYDYVMNYLSHIIQKPYKKTGVCLALHSKQGAGKGVVLKAIERIIGDMHYSQNSNAERVFGKFNGLLEAKTLINLDEAFWGGDKKLEGQIKNQITETTQTIEKKTLNTYNINDYCNYIITTNNDWFAGVDEEDRRYFCLELSNEYSGRTSAKNEKYFETIRNVPIEAFAKVLYNRDISQFNPRKFKKTKLLQEQVERNWSSPKVWWNSVLKEGGFNYDGNFIEWGKTLKVDKGMHYETYGLEIKNKNGDKRVVYDKDWLYKVYESNTYDGRKFSNSTFWRDIQKNCIGELYDEKKVQKKKQRKIYVFTPSLDEAREKWYDLQDFDYEYGKEEEDEWEVAESDDEW